MELSSDYVCGMLYISASVCSFFREARYYFEGQISVCTIRPKSCNCFDVIINVASYNMSAYISRFVKIPSAKLDHLAKDIEYRYWVLVTDMSMR